MLTDSVTGVTAGVAMTSWFWLPALQTVSTVAALLLPIFGCAWFAMQIVVKYKEYKERKNNKDRL